MVWKKQSIGTKDTDTMENELIVTVNYCARCGQNHVELKFDKFIHHIEDSDGTIWNYWTLCPNTKEPILLKILDENNGKN